VLPSAEQQPRGQDRGVQVGSAVTTSGATPLPLLVNRLPDRELQVTPFGEE